MTCPSCCSNNTSTFRMSYLKGSRTTSNNYHSESYLSEHLSPPKKPAMSGCLFFILVILSILFTGFVFLKLNVWLVNKPFNLKVDSLGRTSVLGQSFFYSDITFFLCFLLFLFLFFLILLILRPTKRARKKYQKELDIWENSMICLRCGNSWVLANAQ